jgi:NADH-quinone oxidoreductase subunit E/NADP-reducing hydrogenase subunit HndA
MEKLNSKTLDTINKIVAKHESEIGPVKLMLHDVQHEVGYIPFEAMEAIATAANVSVAEVYGVVTFYTQFTTEPKGENIISVCLGTACYVRGAQKLLDRICDLTATKANQTRADMKFSVDATRCLGCCGLAPVCVVNGKVFGNALENKDVEDYLKTIVNN